MAVDAVEASAQREGVPRRRRDRDRPVGFGGREALAIRFPRTLPVDVLGELKGWVTLHAVVCTSVLGCTPSLERAAEVVIYAA